MLNTFVVVLFYLTIAFSYYIFIQYSNARLEYHLCSKRRSPIEAEFIGSGLSERLTNSYINNKPRSRHLMFDMYLNNILMFHKSEYTIEEIELIKDFLSSSSKLKQAKREMDNKHSLFNLVMVILGGCFWYMLFNH